MSNTTTNVNEYNVIAKVVQQYINGAKSGKGDDMKPAFHKDATVFGYVGDDLFSGPIQQVVNDKSELSMLDYDRFGIGNLNRDRYHLP